MTQAIDLLEDQIRHLHNQGRLRVWSLVITIFGDAVQLRGGRVAISVMQSLTDRLGVEVGALRTAMSRLAKDGWVTREKRARHSFYRLNSNGAGEFEAATRRIYAGQSGLDRCDLTIGVLPKGRSDAGIRKFLAQSHALGVRNGVAIWANDTAPPAHDLEKSGVFCVQGNPWVTPNWVKEALGSDDHKTRYRNLSARWDQAANNISLLHKLEPLDAMALRTLLIHDWRRCLLRQPDLPAELLPGDWPEPECRAQIGAIYHALLPSSEAWWTDNITPDGMDALDHRFPTQAPVTLRNFIDG